VGGLTTESKDFNDLLKRTAPHAFAFVLALAARSNGRREQATPAASARRGSEKQA
jgi:hypothetical protein